MSRPDRVGEFMREEISRIILQELADPRIGFVTVTGVDVSPDLMHARVRVSVMGDDAKKRTSLRGLRHSASFIQTAVFRRMRVKRVPEISFELDDSVEQAYRMSKLIREARASDPDGGRIPTEEVLPEDPAAAADEGAPGGDANARPPKEAVEEEPPIEEY